ncbi:MAG: hypothetical protein R6W75_08760, partial [Smithellaceae bacterium]
ARRVRVNTTSRSDPRPSRLSGPKSSVLYAYTEDFGPDSLLGRGYRRRRSAVKNSSIQSVMGRIFNMRAVLTRKPVSAVSAAAPVGPIGHRLFLSTATGIGRRTGIRR